MDLDGLASCTSFDDPTTENYGAAPGIDINITPGAQTDSAFTVTITPQAGALYYAYIIDQNDEAEHLDSATLYKGGYGNTVVKVADQPTTTITIDNATPNTTYQVYAVAGSDKGIVGNVVVKSITTTDKFSPRPQSVATDPDNAAVQLKFSEAIKRGEGAVTAKYYKEWDLLDENMNVKSVDVPAEDITVQVSGNAATFIAANIPAGAHLCFSYAAGAFTDLNGNPCNALNSGLNLNTGKFTNAYVHVTNKPFDIADAYVAPTSGTPVGDWEAFRGTVTFPYDIFRNDETVEKGDVQVVYVNDNREIAYNLEANQWAVEGNKLTFVLPTEPAIGDMILFNIAEGAIADVYGNVNNEYVSENIEWKYVGFVPTKEMLIGPFEVNYISYWSEDGSVSSLGSINIEENTEKENTLTIKNLFIEGSAIEATYDLEMGKLIIADDQALGKYVDEDGEYTAYFYTADGADAATFTINKDGSLTGDGLWGIYVLNDTSKGWIDVAAASQLVPIKAGSRKAAARAKSVKTMKLHKAARTLKKNGRK